MKELGSQWLSITIFAYSDTWIATNFGEPSTTNTANHAAFSCSSGHTLDITSVNFGPQQAAHGGICHATGMG